MLVGCLEGCAPVVAIPIGLTADGVDVAVNDVDEVLLAPGDGRGGPDVVALDALAFFCADML